MFDYKSSGVNLKNATNVVEIVSKITSDHLNMRLFAGQFPLPGTKVNPKQPILWSSCDGVGTKILLVTNPLEMKNLAQDLVGMVLNDLLCHNARPLFFLDYFACQQFNKAFFTNFIQGLKTQLTKLNCVLLGGETAELNNLYSPHKMDVSGFAVGICQRKEIIDGQKIIAGDIVLGLGSSGVHSNGFSLIRELINNQKLDLERSYHSLGTLSLKKVLLTPTTIYVKPILQLTKTHMIHGMAHITGGGLAENIQRILPSNCQLELNLTNYKPLAIFDLIQTAGSIQTSEMYKIFNMGIGFVLIFPNSQLATMQTYFKKCKIQTFVLGQIQTATNPKTAATVTIKW